MGCIKSHRDLKTWQLSFELARRSMKAAATFPRTGAIGLSSQVSRCAISVPSNVAEGFGRGSRLEYLRFLKIARGSLFELDTQLLMARELGYITERGYESLHKDWIQVSKVLAGLITKLQSKKPTPRPTAPAPHPAHSIERLMPNA